MAVSLRQFTRRRHPEVFEQVYLYGTSPGSLQTLIQTPDGTGGIHVYRNRSTAIEELAQRLLEDD